MEYSTRMKINELINENWWLWWAIRMNLTIQILIKRSQTQKSIITFIWISKLGKTNMALKVREWLPFRRKEWELLEIGKKGASEAPVMFLFLSLGGSYMGYSLCGNSLNYFPVIVLFYMCLLYVHILFKNPHVLLWNYVCRALCKKGRLSCCPAIYFIFLTGLSFYCWVVRDFCFPLHEQTSNLKKKMEV